MARPTSNPTETVTTKLNETQLACLDQYARATGLSRHGALADLVMLGHLSALGKATPGQPLISANQWNGCTVTIAFANTPADAALFLHILRLLTEKADGN